ncbi:TfoX/Sxy family protein [Arthrobacter subterraneus]|nr:TfoX/Sxy family protein [Arthrobacter subterraneus]
MTAADGPREALAHRIRAILNSQQDVREIRMFGGVCFMVDGRMAVAAGRDGGLLVRTDPSRYDDLLTRGAEPATMSRTRPMGRGWITVPGPRLEGEEELAWWVSLGVGT